MGRHTTGADRHHVRSLAHQARAQGLTIRDIARVLRRSYGFTWQILNERGTCRSTEDDSDPSTTRPAAPDTGDPGQPKS